MNRSRNARMTAGVTAVCSALLTFGVWFPGVARGGSVQQSGSVPTITGPFLSQRVAPSVYHGDLREMPVIPHQARVKGVGPRAITSTPSPLSASNSTDTATMQTSTSGGTNTVTPGPFANPGANFEGMDSSTTPPDTNGAIGPNDYIQMVNFGFQVFSRTGTSLAGPSNINQMWIDAGDTSVCTTSPRGDPYVLYDQLADRWVVSQLAFAVKTDPWHVCIAVSKTSDPVSGGWYLYDFNQGHTADYPKLGLWPDAWYLSTQEGYSGGPVDVVALDRADMLNGNPVVNQTFSASGNALVMIPADFEGTTPALGRAGIFARFVDDSQGAAFDQVQIYNFHVDWGVPSNSTFGLSATLPVAEFNATDCNGLDLNNDCVPQPGTTATLEASTVWTASPVYYRNFGSYQAMTLTHTVNVGSNVTGIRWYELRAPDAGDAWSVYQQSTFNPQTTTDASKQLWRWMSSAAMDQAGDIALGYNVSDAVSTYPGIDYTGRLATDPLGTMSQGEQTLQAGTGSWGSGGTRWGDYGMMRVDPVDNCTFWFTTEYSKGSTQGTRIASFRFPTCNPADLAVSQSAFDPQSASSTNATSGQELDYTANVSNNGPATATNVNLSDAIDSALTVISTSVPCTVGSGAISCKLGTMASGASTSVLIRTQVPEGYNVDNGALANLNSTATVSADQLDPTTSNNTSTLAEPVTDSADLKIAKVCDATIGAGQTGTCTIYIDNYGPSAARNTVVTDQLSSGNQFQVTSATASQGSGCTVNPTIMASAVTVSCPLGAFHAAPLPATYSRATMTVKFTGNEAQTISDTASVTSGTSDPTSSDNSASASVPVTAISDLAVSAPTASPSPVVAGTQETFVTTVTNNGPSTAQNVLVTNALPSNVTVATVTGSASATCVTGTPGNAASPTSCSFGTLAPSASNSMTVTVNIDPTTTSALHVDSAVSSATFDNNNANNTNHVDVPVSVHADPALTSLSATPSPVTAGTGLSYVATLTNLGPSTAVSVTLNEPLPAGETFVNTSISNGGSGTCAYVTTGSVQCQLNNLGPTQAVTVYTHVGVNANFTGGSESLTATAGASSDTNAGNDSATTTVPVSTSADVALTYTGPATYKASTTITYANNVVNNGPSDAQAVKVVDTLPSTKIGHFVSTNAGDGVCSLSSNILTCNLGLLAAGASKLFSVQFYIQGNQKTVTSSAAETSTTSDPTSADNNAVWSMTSK